MIIPVHSRERYVHRCLRSILDQSLDADDYEVLVVDDGSANRTARALRMFEGHIRLNRHPECLGLPGPAAPPAFGLFAKPAIHSR